MKKITASRVKPAVEEHVPRRAKVYTFCDGAEYPPPLCRRCMRSSAVGTDRVLRGGSWNNAARNCRTANRNGNAPRNRDNNAGFRLVSVP